MLSFVLPLLGLAIVLTPVVASTRELYRRELDEQSLSTGHIKASVMKRSEWSRGSFVKTLT